MIFDLLLKGGELPGAPSPVDIGIRDGLIMAVGRYLSSDKLCPVFDVRGKWVLPGLVDLWHSPGAGEAAARGGVTLACVRSQAEPGVTLAETLAKQPRPVGVDYCFSYRVADLPSADALTQGQALGLAAIAFTFAELDDAQAAELLLRAQAAHLAVFFLPHNHGYTRDGDRFGTLKRMGPAPTPTAHGEELDVARVLALAEITRTAVHVLGVSTAAALSRVRLARKAGAAVSASVFAHNLLLHRGLYRWRRGLWYRPQPPLRTKAETLALWRLLGHDSIALASTARGRGELTPALDPASLPIAESAPRALLKRAQRVPRGGEAIAAQRKAFPRMALRLSEVPAALLGFAGERSPLAVGCVADLAVFDPHAREVLGPRRPKDRGEWEPLVGVPAVPPPSLVVRRGRVVVDEKGLRDEPGQLAIPIVRR